MGYPIHSNFNSFRFLISTILILCLVLCLFPAEGLAAPPALRSIVPPGDWDQVIITDKSLIESFSPLARHRRGQGLRCRIVPLHVVQQWSGQGDLMEDIRHFVATISREWGTRYVLLGGDAESIPVPLGYFSHPAFSWDIPMDLYYAAPNGEWDADGDGILGEIEDDEPDFTPVVALGRAPVSDREETHAFVEKVMAFENDGPADKSDFLLTAEVG